MVTLIIEDCLNNYICPMQERMKTLGTEMEWSLKTILNEKSMVWNGMLCYNYVLEDEIHMYLYLLVYDRLFL